MTDSREYHTSGQLARCPEEGQGSVALVHYGDPGITWRCVESILGQEGKETPIVIMDHGPGRPLAECLPASCMSPNLEIIRSANRGFGSGCNLAADRAFENGAEWVWFLNNDAMIQAPVFSRLLELARSFPEVGLWGTHQRNGSRVLGADRLPSWFLPPPASLRLLDALPAGCRQLEAHETLSGASILVSRQAWGSLGHWPEWCFLYHEDVAWCLRAHGLGIPMVLTPLEILHTPSTSTGRRSPLTTYYGVRNSLLLHAEHWPGKKGVRLIQSIHLLQKRFFQGRWKQLWPTLRGIVDASRGKRFRT